MNEDTSRLSFIHTCSQTAFLPCAKDVRHVIIAHDALDLTVQGPLPSPNRQGGSIQPSLPLSQSPNHPGDLFKLVHFRSPPNTDTDVW